MPAAQAKANPQDELIRKKPGRPPSAKKQSQDYTNYEFTEADLVAGLSDPMWRLNNLYHVVDEKKKNVVFRVRPVQAYLLENMHTRNVILKARKEGISTVIQLLMLDTAMFSPNVRGVIIAQDIEKAQAIFRDVIKFTYDNLPEVLKGHIELESSPSKSSINFSNAQGNSLIEVRCSARGVTPTTLHVSEFGKIAAQDPAKAEEIITGSISAVAEDGLIFVESTAEGQAGHFFNMVETARRLQESGKPLWKLDFKFFFYGWWQNPAYIMPSHFVTETAQDVEYFDDLESKIGLKLSPEQRAWRVKYKNSSYAGSEELMNREMPGTPDEAFKVSMEGAYFKDQFRQIRKEGRISFLPYDRAHSASTFWDIGQNDATCLFIIQPLRTFFGVINYIEASGEPFSYFVQKLEELGYVYDYHYLPHDANHRRQGATVNLTPCEMLQSVAPHYRVMPIERSLDKISTIQQARTILGQCVFDEKNCAVGLRHLENYRKNWNARSGSWSDLPRHDEASNAADAFQQFAMAKSLGLFSSVGSLMSANGTAFGSEFIEDVQLGF